MQSHPQAKTARNTIPGKENDRTAIDNEAQPSGQPRETAQYVADMILELRNMSRASKLHKVTVALEFAYYEAFGAANSVEPPAEEVKRLTALNQAAKRLAGGDADD